MLRFTGAAAYQTVAPAASESPVSEYFFDSPRSSFLEDFRDLQRVKVAHANPLVSRLQRLSMLPPEAIFELQSLTRISQIRPAGYVLFHGGKRCDHVCVLVEGVACRYHMLSGGRRQILGFILPGDLCDVDFVTVAAPDHSVSLLTEGRVIKISAVKLIKAIDAFPAIGRAIEMAAMVDKAILRQWLVNVSQRNAIERISHFLCEFVTRLDHIGYLSDESLMPFGINQMALADALGMSAVHVNRTLQALRGAGMIVLRKRHLHVLDRARLEAVGAFNPDYMQIQGNLR